MAVGEAFRGGSEGWLSSRRWTRVVAAVFSSVVRRLDLEGDDDLFFFVEHLIFFVCRLILFCLGRIGLGKGIMPEMVRGFGTGSVK